MSNAEIGRNALLTRMKAQRGAKRGIKNKVKVESAWKKEQSRRVSQ
jgi:hypothetical protein